MASVNAERHQDVNMEDAIDLRVSQMVTDVICGSGLGAFVAEAVLMTEKLSGSGLQKAMTELSANLSQVTYAGIAGAVLWRFGTFCCRIAETVPGPS